MELSIQERLKDLRVERGLMLEQLAEKTHLSKSALGSYEGDNFKDISHYALIELAKFYEVSVDYLLGRSLTKNHPNAALADLHLSDDMIELLKSGLVDNSLLCELATHPDFPRFMADLEIYVNGVAGKQVQSANAIVDAVSATIMKQHNSGLTDPQLRQLIAAHIDDDSFCRFFKSAAFCSFVPLQRKTQLLWQTRVAKVLWHLKNPDLSNAVSQSPRIQLALNSGKKMPVSKAKTGILSQNSASPNSGVLCLCREKCSVFGKN